MKEKGVEERMWRNISSISNKSCIRIYTCYIAVFVYDEGSGAIYFAFL